MVPDDEKKPEDDKKEEGEGKGKGKEKEGNEGAEGDAPPSTGGKNKLIVIGAAALLLIAVPVGLYFAGIIPHFGADKGTSHVEGEEGGDKYLDLEEFLVNLNTTGKTVSFLKMTVSLVVEGQKDYAVVEAAVPRIRDSFQVYLRELRSDDLQGSAGIYRLREELLLRVNKVVYPAKVKDILFKEILVQ